VYAIWPRASSRNLPLNLAALAATFLAAAATRAVAQSPPTLTLADGDRVVLLGSTLVEREGSYGYLETALTARFHTARIQFRNLGWSGDTVFGEARAGFGSPADGFAQLKEHVLALKPTVIYLNYGANESFAGPAGLQQFNDGLAALLAMLDQTQARVVFLTPPPQEDLGRPLPDPSEHNRHVKLYASAIADVARQRQAPLVNLFELLGGKLSPPSEIPLTDNGLHFTPYGYWRLAGVVEQALGLQPRPWFVDADAARRNIAADGVTISDARFAPGAIRFQAVDGQLPLAPPPADAPPNGVASLSPRVVRVFGLAAGRYVLKIDGQAVAEAAAEAWTAGVHLVNGPDHAQAERLRQVILAKNELYFHRWRPQNVTYLFGFRKHEQGQNAVEIPQFDPLVEAKEAEIHKLAAPQPRRYELLRMDAR
jgi:lysophospholipase L1-like esterase